MKKIATYGIIAVLLIASITIVLPTNVKAEETWDPMIYDSPEVGTPPGNDNGIIDYYEAVNAAQDYFKGIITYSQVMDVFVLYEGGNIIVDDDADPSWYDSTHVKTIQEGINNASEGNIVFVHNGTYFENVVVNKSVSLIGENKNNTIIDGGESGDVVFISADGVNISGFKIQKSGDFSAYPTIDSGIEIISNGSLVRNCIFKDVYSGLYINSSSNNSIIYNKFNDSFGGILISFSTHNTINNNDFRDGADGESIILFYSSNNKIIENKIHQNTLKALWLYFSSDNEIKSNEIIQNYRGLVLDASHRNTIYDNIIKNNTDGIELDASSNNSICKNNIYDNNIGIVLYSSESAFKVSSDNSIYYNNFSDNMLHANDTGNNIWDDGIKGNYWDDYEGIDSDSDGIGDTPYNISGGDNKDYYPLMEPYSPPVQAELEVSIETGFGVSFKKVSAKIENIGDSSANNVNLSIYVEYGLFNKKANSSIEFNVLESDSVSELLTLGGLRGFGRIKVAAEAFANNAEKVNTTVNGWIIGKIIFLNGEID